MSVPVELLRRVPLLAGLGDDDLAALAARFRERVYDAGAPVTTRGSAGAGFFVIAEGEAGVGATERPLAPLRRPDFFCGGAPLHGGRRGGGNTPPTHQRPRGVSPR